MAYTYKKNCKVCQLIRKQGGEKSSDLLKRIYNSRAYDDSGESLANIFKDYGGGTDNAKFGYLGLINHSKTHQVLESVKLAEKRIKNLQDQVEEEKLKKVFTHHDVRGLMRDLAGAQLEAGDMKLSGAVTASILKQEMEIEEKQKDREFEIMKMVAAFQSGALEQEVIDGEVVAHRIT